MHDIKVNAAQLLVTMGILAATFVALLALKPMDRKTREEVRRFEETRILIFLFGLTTVALVAVYASTAGKAWGVALALLPFIMIVQHAMFLRNVRQPILVPRSPLHGKPGARDRPRADGDDDTDWWRSVLEAARRTSERYFSAGSLAIRYGASAVAVLMVSLVAFVIIFASDEDVLGTLQHPAMLGAAGAYVYVLLHLGYRNFTHDLTSGGAMWCSISLAAGPILACAISHFLAPPPGDSNLGVDAVYFMAGLSPRYVTSRVEDLVKKAWGSSSAAGALAPRTTPVTQVKGITPEIAERLEEEGIADVHGLAMADPLRLIRNTNFDKRLIVSWIDEALLITTLPDHWKALERNGITGAVALVSLVYSPPYAVQKRYEYPEDVKKAHLAALCHHIGSETNDGGESSVVTRTDDTILRSVAAHLQDDAQLRLVWVLHNHISDESLSEASEKQLAN